MKILYKCIVGSHAYGTNIEGSDQDIKGVYIQDPQDEYLYGYKEQIEVSKDEVYYELNRFLRLCQTNNPTMLELLFMPDDMVLEVDPMFRNIVLSQRDLFISKSCRHSFGGYAIDQIRKARGLDKKMNWENDRKVRKDILDFCWIYITNATFRLTENHLHYDSVAVPLKKFLKENHLDAHQCGLVKIEHMRDAYLLFYDHIPFTGENTNRGRLKDCEFKGIAGENSNEVRLSTIPEYMHPEGILYFNKDAYQIHCKEYGEYQKWLEERNTQRYVDVANHGQKIDGKNLLHCVRLLQMAREIAEQGTLTVRRPNADYLISIRRGQVDLETILQECEKEIEALDKAYENSSLPNKCNPKVAESIIYQIKYNHYQTVNTHDT